MAERTNKSSCPELPVNGPDGAEKVLRPSPSPSGGIAAKVRALRCLYFYDRYINTNVTRLLCFLQQSPADALPAFRDFVTNEKQRLTQKKQALVKNEMDKRVAELVKFSQSFKVGRSYDGCRYVLTVICAAQQTNS